MSAKLRPAHVEVKPRDIRFGAANHGQRHWLGGDPVGTAVMNAMSLTFPDGERLFMDAVRHFRDQLSPKLQDDVRAFIAQEAIHSREHHVLNQLVDPKHYPAAEILAAVREGIAETRKAGPWPMLLATISLEHFTAMMADLRVQLDDLFAKADPAIERMWRWHAMEEMEHKAVAFDVYLEAARDWSPFTRYVRRILSMTVITRRFVETTTRHAEQLLMADGYSAKAARKAVRRYVWSKPGLFSRGWRSYLAWYRPGFHPWDHKAPKEMAAWRAEFDALSAAAPQGA